MVAPNESDGLVIRRRYAAPPHVVFEFWTRPEFLAKWLRPSAEYTHQFVEVDPTVGGRYRIAFEAPDGRVDVVGGEYLEVTPPNRLAFSWKWEPPNQHAGIDSKVIVQFREIDGETELLLTHDLADPVMKEEHNQGWTGALDQIADLIVELNISEAG